MLKRFRKYIQENPVFVLIVVLAATLRFVYLANVPPSLNWDEVSHGYNAYSILKSGKDEWGNRFPAIFKAYGDYKLPVYIYITALLEAILGLTVFSVRLPSALAGMTTVLFTYLLAKKLFSKKVAILSSLLVAVEPWSFFLSRGAFEANLASAFIISGIYFFFLGIKKPKYLPLSAFLLGLSVWTYNSARIFVPLFVGAMFIFYKKELQNIFMRDKRITIYSLLITIFLFLPMFWQLLNPQGQARYGRVTILDEGAIAQINETRATSNLYPSLARLIHNKATFFTSKFVKNWASHYSGDFLYFAGGSHYQFSVPGHGLLYPINALFLIVGVFLLLKRRSKESILILAWFFIGPVASSLTREAPHVLRSITFLPAPMIITAYGLINSYQWIKTKFTQPLIFPKILLFAYIVVLFGFVENYLETYFSKYRKDYSWSWQYGYRQAIEYIKEVYDEYDKIIFTKKYGEPHEFFLFYWPWDPGKYREDPNLVRFYQSNWYWVDRFDKFYFVNDWEIPKQEWENFKLESGEEFDCEISKCLLITSPDNYPKNWDKIVTINFLDGKPAFEILKN